VNFFVRFFFWPSGQVDIYLSRGKSYVWTEWEITTTNVGLDTPNESKGSTSTHWSLGTVHPYCSDAVASESVNGRRPGIDVMRGCFGDRKVFFGKVLGVSLFGYTHLLPVYVRFVGGVGRPRRPAARNEGTTTLACEVISISKCG